MVADMQKRKGSERGSERMQVGAELQPWLRFKSVSARPVLAS